VKAGEAFYYADEFNVSWHPTIRALWSPVGRQVMIPTPAQPTRRYGLGAVDWHSGEAVVIARRRKRRREVAELLEALLALARRRPRALGLPFSLWTAARLADHLAELAGVRMSAPSVCRLLREGGMALSRPQHTITSPDPEYALKKGRSRRPAAA